MLDVNCLSFNIELQHNGMSSIKYSCLISLSKSCSELFILLFVASFKSSNVLIHLIVRNADYAQTGLLQFFIVNGVCEMNDLF